MPEASEYPRAAEIPESGTGMTMSASTGHSLANWRPKSIRTSCTLQPAIVLSGLAKYIYSKARESRDKDGNLTFISDKERIKLIKDMEVFELEKNKILKIDSLIKKGIIYE